MQQSLMACLHRLRSGEIYGLHKPLVLILEEWTDSAESEGPNGCLGQEVAFSQCHDDISFAVWSLKKLRTLILILLRW